MDPQATLFAAFEALAGHKTLVLDRSLSSTISSLVTFPQLRDKGFESVKWLEHGILLDDTSSQRIVVLLRSVPRQISQAIHLVRANRSRRFTFFVVPCPSSSIKRQLANSGIQADVHIKSLPIRMIQDDVDHWRVETVDREPDSPIVSMPELDTACDALLEFVKESGTFTRVRACGRHATRFVEIFTQRICKVLDAPPVKFGELLVLDRYIDLITPMLSQLTYEGLLYETYGVRAGVLELPPPVSGEERKITLGPGDGVFMALRGENLSTVGDRLSGQAAVLSSEYGARHDARNTKELRVFVQKLPNLQTSEKSLKMHIELAEQLYKQVKGDAFRAVFSAEQSLCSGASESEIFSQIEQLVAQQIPLDRVLRLVCLWSGVHNGLKQKDYETLANQIIQAYGHSHQLTLHRLRRMGLFVIRSPELDRRGGWSGFSRSWQLYNDEVGEKSQEDLSYLYSGYCPLSMRILQAILEGDSARHKETLRRLRVSNVDMELNTTSTKSIQSEPGKIALVFLGGCTAAEMAGVRWLAQKLNRTIVIFTTGVITGSTLLKTYVVN
ncbi:Vacuolar protein-sorting-associated protein 33 [Savitreella phatthalungensis]